MGEFWLKYEVDTTGSRLRSEGGQLVAHRERRHKWRVMGKRERERDREKAANSER
jgi:hypothetical protein